MFTHTFNSSPPHTTPPGNTYSRAFTLTRCSFAPFYVFRVAAVFQLGIEDHRLGHTLVAHVCVCVHLPMSICVAVCVYVYVCMHMCMKMVANSLCCHQSKEFQKASSASITTTITAQHCNNNTNEWKKINNNNSVCILQTMALCVGQRHYHRHQQFAIQRRVCCMHRVGSSSSKQSCQQTVLT